MSLYENAAEMIHKIEDEMKRIGYWQNTPLAPEAYEFTQAFGMDTMAFVQWLQFILIPRVHEIIEQKGEFPKNSSVGAQAARELNDDPNAAHLVSLLSDFDELFL